MDCYSTHRYVVMLCALCERCCVVVLTFLPSYLLSTTTLSTREYPLYGWGGGKMQCEITYFLASGKNYFYTISYLLMNQAHISKGVRVESFTASL